MTAREIIEKENIIIKNGTFYKKKCIENCPHIIMCKYCEHKLSKYDFNIVYNAIQHHQINW